MITEALIKEDGEIAPEWAMQAKGFWVKDDIMEFYVSIVELYTKLNTIVDYKVYGIKHIRMSNE